MRGGKRDAQRLAASLEVGPGSASAVGRKVVDVLARTDGDTAGLMTWQITDLGFRMRLSSKVPAVLQHHVVGVTTELLQRHHLSIDDVAHWAVHPGGPRIVDTVARRLGLSGDATAASRDVLRRHGNCSSATTLLLLQQMVQDGVAVR